ncbi:MAG: DUF1800 domain-containing protein [Armatimonadetes bacterium]|nr:DUF1800 domain-containing protein [Armatimonadota bacterium]
MRRRHFLSLGAAALGAGLLSGCETVEQRLTKTPLPADPLPPPGEVLNSPALRVLNRVAYGPRPGDVDRVEKIGVAAYVDEQLAPERLAEDARLTWRLRSLDDTLNANAGDLFDVDDHRLVGTLRQAALLRAVYSRRQLQERMAEFWGDHFNIYAFKGQGPQLIIADDRDTIRTHALGRFRDLLGASARSAAMLGYLDNGVNVKGVPNENYARELMELHTLGVHGGYTQRDVQEVARCLTGWTMDTGWHRGRFKFDSARHDDGAKRVLGMTIPAGGGVRDGERVLDLLAAHPATARHLARKLCVHFLGTVPEVWVSRLAAVYAQTGGDIKALLRPLLTSPDLQAAPPILKRPLDYAVSALRAWNADTDGGPSVQRHLEAMGQPLFAWPMPDGFPEKASAWTGSLIPRWNFALALTGNQVENTTLDWDALAGAGRAAGLGPHEALLTLAFGCRAAEPALASLRACQQAHSDVREYAALALMSPQFQWR